MQKRKKNSERDGGYSGGEKGRRRGEKEATSGDFSGANASLWKAGGGKKKVVEKLFFTAFPLTILAT